MSERLWTREEVLLAINLYCKLPYAKLRQTTPEIIELAYLLGRTPSAISMRCCNYVQFDPVESKRVKGFVRAAKLDRAIFAEISSDWENFAVESEQLLHQYRKTSNPLNNSKINNVQIDEIELPVGYAKEQITRVRIGQQFFRATVLSSYNHQCCITGLSNDLLLIASHIKPWKDSDSKTERTNPRNGLCLSPLYDKTFDAGLMTVDEQYRIVFDKQLFSCVENAAANYFFKQYHGKPLNLPERFLPDQLFLEYHRNNIFRNKQ